MASKHTAAAIERKIAAGEFYDAQQMVKSVYRRLCAKGLHDDATRLCVETAQRLCSVQQYDLAVDLGKDLVSMFKDESLPASDENVGCVESVLEGVPPYAASQPKFSLLKGALAWTKSSSSTPYGSPKLHKFAAKAYQSEKEYGHSQAHLVYCKDGPGLCSLVKEWREEGYPGELDLFSLRTLLILLVMNDLTTARSFWDSFEYSVEPAPEPPVQCGIFLLAACEGKLLDFFRAVRAKYTLVFRRDPTFDSLLDSIEQEVFGMKQQATGIGALLESILNMGGNMGDCETSETHEVESC